MNEPLEAMEDNAKAAAAALGVAAAEGTEGSWRREWAAAAAAEPCW